MVLGYDAYRSVYRWDPPLGTPTIGLLAVFARVCVGVPRILLRVPSLGLRSPDNLSRPYGE